MRSLLFMVAMSGGAACITNERAPDRPEADGADGAETDEGDAEVGVEADVPICSVPGDCDDHNACTIDTCEPAIGCQHANASDTIACTRTDAVAGCHDLVFQAPAHCDGAGACIAPPTQNCAAQAPAECQRTACDDVTGCGSEPVADGEECHIPDNFSDACVSGERHAADTCASGICQDAYSEPCAVGYCEVAACDGKACSKSDMGRDATMVTPAQWAFVEYVRGADGAVAVWRGRVVVTADGTWKGTAENGGTDVPPSVNGNYCVSPDGELSWRFASTDGPGQLTFRGLLSTHDDLGVAWDAGGTAFLLLTQFAELPPNQVRGHAFRVFGFDATAAASEAFVGTLAVDPSDDLTGSWVSSTGETAILTGDIGVFHPDVFLSLVVAGTGQKWRGISSGTTGVTWFVRQGAAATTYGTSLLVMVDEAFIGPTPPTLTGRFRFGALDFDRAPLATHGDTEIGAGVVTSLRQFSPDGTLWRMTPGPANTLVVATDGSYLQSTSGPAAATLRRAGHIGLWSDNAAGFFVDIEAAPADPNDASVVPAAPRFRFGFRPH